MQSTSLQLSDLFMDLPFIVGSTYYTQLVLSM